MDPKAKLSTGDPLINWKQGMGVTDEQIQQSVKMIEGKGLIGRIFKLYTNFQSDLSKMPQAVRDCVQTLQKVGQFMKNVDLNQIQKEVQRREYVAYKSAMEGWAAQMGEVAKQALQAGTPIHAEFRKLEKDLRSATTVMAERIAMSGSILAEIEKIAEGVKTLPPQEQAKAFTSQLFKLKDLNPEKDKLIDKTIIQFLTEKAQANATITEQLTASKAALALFKESVHRDMQANLPQETLYRDDQSFTIKLLQNICFTERSGWLKGIVENPQIKSGFDELTKLGNELVEKHKKETPGNAKDEATILKDDIIRNTPSIQKLVVTKQQKMLRAIMTPLAPSLASKKHQEVPADIREMLTFMETEVSAKYPAHKGMAFTQLLLRAIAPAITTPQDFGLAAFAPQGVEKTFRIYLGAMIQQLATDKVLIAAAKDTAFLNDALKTFLGPDNKNIPKARMQALLNP